MQYRRLGKAGLQVSTISLGNWLTHGGYIAEEKAIASVRQSYDLGINLFDTSNAYNRGAAEIVLGRALKDYPRDSYVVATKVFFPMGEKPNQRGLSRKHIMEQCEASLRRMGLEYVDVYQCHRYDPNTPLEETLRALDDLVTQGKILYAGVSEWTGVQIAEAIAFARQHNMDQIVSNQPQYSLLARYIEAEIIPLCTREGIGQIVFSPLAQGVLTGKYRPGEPLPAGTRATVESANMFMGALLRDEVLTAVQELQPIAQQLGISMAQLALAWVLRQPNVSSAIIGASSPEQIIDNAGAADVALDDATIAAIEAVMGGIRR